MWPHQILEEHPDANSISDPQICAVFVDERVPGTQFLERDLVLVANRDACCAFLDGNKLPAVRGGTGHVGILDRYDGQDGFLGAGGGGDASGHGGEAEHGEGGEQRGG